MLLNARIAIQITDVVIGRLHGSSICKSLDGRCPLQEVIREAPRSLAGLLEVLLPRLQPRREVRGVALDDQKSFVSLP